MLAVAKQNVEVVIPKNALSSACIDQLPDEGHDSGAVGAAVGEVADKNESAAFGVESVSAVAQTVHQGAQGFDLTVDISHDIERAFKKRLN